MYETAHATPRVEMFLPEGGPGWVDVSEDVISNVRVQWGMNGSSPKDRVASPGPGSFSLDNSPLNSAGLEGYYSPGHEDCREGFGIGTQVRLVLSHPLFGDRVRWLGTIKSAPPNPDVRDPRTTVTAVDWMEQVARAKPSGLSVMVDTQADEVFTELLTSVTKQPPEVSSSAGSDVYPFALDNIKDESSTLLSEFQKLAVSEFGYIYVKAGRLVFEGRSVRAAAGAPAFALTEDFLQSMRVSHGQDQVLNRIQVIVHPRRRDGNTNTVLFRLGSALRIERGTTQEFDAPYRDPNQQAVRVGGMDIVDPPVASTDYFFNSAQDGSGTDLTAQLSVVLTPGGNSAKVQITNNGPFDGYVPEGDYQIRGRGLYDQEPIISDLRDTDSAEDYGGNDFKFDMPYQSSPAIASDTAQFIRATNKDPRTRIEAVTFWANWDETVLQQVFLRDISDLVSVTSARLGVNQGVYYINGVALDISLAGAIKVTYVLAPANTTQAWTLQVDGKTELDETTVLGYGLFVPRWVLNSDELGTGTFLN